RAGCGARHRPGTRRDGRARPASRARPPPASGSRRTGSGSSCASKRLAQPPDGAEEVTLDASGTQSESLGHLGGRALLDVPEHEHLPLSIGESPKGQPDPPPSLRAGRRVRGAGVLGGDRDVLDAIAPVPEPHPPAGPAAVTA